MTITRITTVYPTGRSGQKCALHGIELETYTITGGIWNEETDDFDITPRTLETCPKCESGYSEDESEHVIYCEYCGDHPATHTARCEDRCPTDRGDEIREYTMDLCDQCDSHDHQRD